MKYIVTILLVGFMVGCQPSEEHVNLNYERICVDGVVYLYNDDPYRESLSVKFDQNSKVVTCNGRLPR